MSTRHIFTDFNKDLNRYFRSKLPDFPEHDLQEISAYITNRVSILTNDLIRERDNGWLKQLNYKTLDELKHERIRDLLAKAHKSNETIKEDNE